MAKNVAANAGSNLTSFLFLDIYRELKSAQREIEAATGRKRAILKRAKSGGVDLDAMALLNRLSKLEADESEMLLRNVARYSTWAQLEIGFQANLFDAVDEKDRSVAGKPADAAAQSEFLADDEGYRAGVAGQAIDGNPYPAGTPQHDPWRTGWHNGQAALGSTLEPREADDVADPDAEADSRPVGPPPKVGRQSGRRKRGPESRAAA